LAHPYPRRLERGAIILFPLVVPSFVCCGPSLRAHFREPPLRWQGVALNGVPAVGAVGSMSLEDAIVF
jgi:hypothetical protein